jgi:uncharacterized protein
METMTNDGKTEVRIRDSTANPAPLGLLAFGMTTVMLNLHNAGIFALGSMIFAMGIFYGGLAQIIAGLMEWKKNNTFGMVAFASYGFFWLTLVFLIVAPTCTIVKIPGEATEKGVIAYFIMWGIFTFCMFIGTIKLTRALQVVFLSLTVLFFMLAATKATGNAMLGKITGFEGIFCGASAIYAAIAQILNEVYGKVVLSLG